MGGVSGQWNSTLRCRPSSPGPASPIPAPSRTGPCVPSAPTTNPARTVRSSPDARVRSRAATPDASCSNPVSSTPNRTVTPSSRARASSTGSSRSWGHSVNPFIACRGSSSSATASRASRPSSAPASVSTVSISRFLRSTRPAARTSAATPTSPNTRIAAPPIPRVRGQIDVPGCRSTTSARTPRVASSTAVVNPTGPAPTISTGPRTTAAAPTSSSASRYGIGRVEAVRAEPVLAQRPCQRRRGNAVTVVPSRTRAVASAIAASATHGAAVGASGSAQYVI